MPIDRYDTVNEHAWNCTAQQTMRVEVCTATRDRSCKDPHQREWPSDETQEHRATQNRRHARWNSPEHAPWCSEHKNTRATHQLEMFSTTSHLVWMVWWDTMWGAHTIPRREHVTPFLNNTPLMLIPHTQTWPYRINNTTVTTTVLVYILSLRQHNICFY